MKTLLSMKYYIAFAIFAVFISISSFAKRWGGDSSDTIEKANVKTIRQNPGSFRTMYLPYIIYSGGK